MELGSRAKAAAFILVASGIGGFAIATKATAFFFEKSKPKMSQEQQEQENERKGAKKVMKQAAQEQKSGSDNEGASKKDEKEGKDRKGKLSEEEEEENKGAGDNQKGKGKDGNDGGGKKLTANSHIGVDAARYLIGNTILLNPGSAEPRYSFHAGRGIMGEGDEHGFTVRNWVLRQDQLCETTPQGGFDCKLVQVEDGPPIPPKKGKRGVAFIKDQRQTADPKAKKVFAEGEVFATLVVGEEQFPIIKGNVAKFPDVIPSIDDPAKIAAERAAALAAASATKIDAPGSQGKPASATIVKASTGGFADAKPVGAGFQSANVAGAGFVDPVAGDRKNAGLTGADEPNTPASVAAMARLRNAAIASGRLENIDAPKYLAWFDKDGSVMEVMRDISTPFEVRINIAAWTFRSSKLCFDRPSGPRPKAFQIDDAAGAAPTGKKKAPARPVTLVCATPEIALNGDTNIPGPRGESLKHLSKVEIVKGRL